VYWVFALRSNSSSRICGHSAFPNSPRTITDTGLSFTNRSNTCPSIISLFHPAIFTSVNQTTNQPITQHLERASLLSYPQHQALQAARQYQQTPEFQQRYATRAGVEGSLSQGIRAFGLRRSRYIGLVKAHLQHIVTSVAMNLVRLMHWWEEIPKAATRVSRFQALAPGN